MEHELPRPRLARQSIEYETGRTAAMDGQRLASRVPAETQHGVEDFALRLQRVAVVPAAIETDLPDAAPTDGRQLEWVTDGDTIRDATRRAHRVLRLRPDTVLVMLGINDLIGGRSPEDCVNDMRQLRDRLRAGAPRARLIVQSVLPVGPSLKRLTPKIAELNRGLVALCADGGCTYLDVAGGFSEAGLSKDDLHLSDEGYRSWASILDREVAAIARR